MAKQSWKPGTMVYPMPAVMVTVADKKGNSNIITVAWTGTVCTNPPMAYISVRPERYSYHMLRETGEFVINLTTEKLVFATDYCGVKSGRDTDKWKAAGLTPVPASKVRAPLIGESPVSIECRVTEVKELGSHHMFLAEVIAVDVDEDYINGRGKFELQKAHPMVYSHGEYYGLSNLLGTFGYSVKKPGTGKTGGRKPAEEKGGRKLTAEKTRGRKPTAEKTSGREAAAEKKSGRRPAAEKTCGRKPAGEKNSGRPAAEKSSRKPAATNKYWERTPGKRTGGKHGR